MAANSALKMAIFSTGQTQTTIADRAGIHESRLSKIIRGHIDATDEEQKALAKVLRLPRHELFPPEAMTA
jgi:transcriptional regulator with XRE-family HTH domain